MEWYKGGVVNAISKCRHEKALFIVYISDNSMASDSTTEAWNSPEVLQLLKTMNSVALQVIKNTTEYFQFSQLFTVLSCPCVYCIDLLGKPLVVMNGEQTQDTLKAKLGEAFSKLEQQLNPGEELGVSLSAQPLPSSESNEEKLKRYEEKIKQRREEKAEAKSQHEKEKEKERISQGKDLMKFREMQAELRNKTWLRERQKEKEAAQSAREEVLAKLEHDRREREDRQHTVRTLSQRSSKATLNAHARASGSMSRIQLRLPVGPTRVIELDTDDTLATLRQRVSEVLDSGSASFSLVRLYPRQELTSDMDLQSMIEMNLVPTGVVIVKMVKGSSSIDAKRNLFWATLMSAMNFIIWLFNLIKRFFVGSSPTRTSIHGGNATSTSTTTEKRLHKFRQEDYRDEDNDDMGTYNGNSTQQQ